MSINTVKCNTFSIGRNLDNKCEYSINNVIIPRVTNIRDLGVIIDNYLKFSPYIVDITNKAFARSALIFRSFVTRDPIILMRAFVTYVRPLLEYCTPVW